MTLCMGNLEHKMIEQLKQYLAEAEAQMEEAKAFLYRCDGAIQTLQTLIKAEEEKESNSGD